MGKGGKKKNWPRSWKQARAGETVTLKGRSVERELVVLSESIQAKDPEAVDEAIVAEAEKQMPS